MSADFTLEILPFEPRFQREVVDLIVSIQRGEFGIGRGFRGVRAGTAQRLLDTLLDHARTRDVRDIFLGTTSKFLAAHRFYAKNGFREIAKSDLPPSFPVMAVDDRFFWRRLDAA
jgi:GNAT superfamily N-acetyltransferase